MQTRSTIARLFAAAFVFGSLVLIPGCPGSNVTHTVSGKVLMADGKTVDGLVIFVGPDNKEIMTGIGPDGRYFMPNPQKGVNKIAVKGTGMAPPTGNKQSLGDKGEAAVKEGPVIKEKAPMMPTGVAPPAKYASITTSGLTYDVKGAGAEEHDITLEKK